MEIGKAALVVPAANPYCATFLVIGRRLRVQFERRIKIGDGLVEVAVSLVGAASIVIGYGKFRVQPDGLGKVGNCLVEFAPAAVGEAPPAIRIGILWVEPDGFGELSNSCVEIPFLHQSLALSRRLPSPRQQLRRHLAARGLQTAPPPSSYGHVVIFAYLASGGEVGGCFDSHAIYPSAGVVPVRSIGGLFRLVPELIGLNEIFFGFGLLAYKQRRGYPRNF